MQATTPSPKPAPFGLSGRNLSYFLAVPVVAFVVLSLAVALVVATYQSQHSGRIYTGVSVWNIDLGGKTRAEARTALAVALTYSQEEAISFVDPRTGQQWHKTPAELGMAIDVDRTVDEALAVGRSGSPPQRLRAMFQSWYYGRTLAPVLVFDEGRLNESLATVAAEINRPPVNAAFDYDGRIVDYVPGQFGRTLDVANTRQRLVEPITNFRPTEVELLIHETEPVIYDTAAEAARVEQILNNPITFYLREPLDDIDLQEVVLPPEEMRRWLRVEVVEKADGQRQHEVFLDENAVRHWLSQYETLLYREPVNARFYFDDNTRELVLVAPHVNGRELDVDATVAELVAQVGSPNRSIPFIVKPIVPEVHSGATAVELGITELITQATTWFYGSSDARKHNIARSAANFFGIVVAPGEEFSFNKYLGSISEADGYEEGLIIVGGRTIKGIGGGVCQVSTTLYQTAFLGGFPIEERWEHGYMLGYYNDGQGPGMDATVFSPIVDFRFTNNTPHHLLIENYYNEEFESLTFKFYSTSLGRRVEKSEPVFANEVPAPTEDEWVYDEDLPPGTVRQIDWATQGADVTVHRTVYNANGDILIDEDVSSHYIPYPNVFHYGPGVEPYDYSLVPGYDN